MNPDVWHLAFEKSMNVTPSRTGDRTCEFQMPRCKLFERSRRTLKRKLVQFSAVLNQIHDILSEFWIIAYMRNLWGCCLNGELSQWWFIDFKDFHGIFQGSSIHSNLEAPWCCGCHLDLSLHIAAMTPSSLMARSLRQIAFGGFIEKCCVWPVPTNLHRFVNTKKYSVDMVLWDWGLQAQYRGGAWHNATVVSSTPDSIQISWKYDGSLDEARGFDNEVFSKTLWLWLVYTIVLKYFVFFFKCVL